LKRRQARRLRWAESRAHANGGAVALASTGYHSCRLDEKAWAGPTSGRPGVQAIPTQSCHVPRAIYLLQAAIRQEDKRSTAQPPLGSDKLSTSLECRAGRSYYSCIAVRPTTRHTPSSVLHTSSWISPFQACAGTVPHGGQEARLSSRSGATLGPSPSSRCVASLDRFNLLYPLQVSYYYEFTVKLRLIASKS